MLPVFRYLRPEELRPGDVIMRPPVRRSDASTQTEGRPIRVPTRRTRPPTVWQPLVGYADPTAPPLEEEEVPQQPQPPQQQYRPSQPPAQRSQQLPQPPPQQAPLPSQHSKPLPLQSRRARGESQARKEVKIEVCTPEGRSSPLPPPTAAPSGDERPSARLTRAVVRPLRFDS